MASPVGSFAAYGSSSDAPEANNVVVRRKRQQWSLDDKVAAMEFMHHQCKNSPSIAAAPGSPFEKMGRQNLNSWKVVGDRANLTDANPVVEERLPSYVLYWQKSRDEVQTHRRSGNRKKRVRRKRKDISTPRYPDIEAAVVTEIHTRAAHGADRSDDTILAFARAIGSHEESFRASATWLAGVRERNDLYRSRFLRPGAGYVSWDEFCVLYPDWLEKQRKWMEDNLELEPDGTCKKGIWNLDEGPICLRRMFGVQNNVRDGYNIDLLLPATMKLHKRFGSYFVCVNAAACQGMPENFPPLVLCFEGTGKRISHDELSAYPSNVKVMFTPRATWTREVAPKWARFFRSCTPTERKRAMFLDCLGTRDGVRHDCGHSTIEFVEVLTNHSCPPRYFPEKSSKWAQPCDQNIIHWIQERVCALVREENEVLYQAWRSFTEMTGSQTQRPRLTRKELRILVAKKAGEAWTDLTQNHSHLIKRAFARTGLSLPLDGRDDHLCHFSGQPVGWPEAMRSLQR